MGLTTGDRVPNTHSVQNSPVTSLSVAAAALLLAALAVTGCADRPATSEFAYETEKRREQAKRALDDTLGGQDDLRRR